MYEEIEVNIIYYYLFDTIINKLSETYNFDFYHNCMINICPNIR